MKNNKAEILNFIFNQLDNKLNRSGIEKSELKDDFDLVKSGLLDSMSFVDLVVDIEKQFGLEIDFDTAFQQAGFTTLSGLVHIIEKEVR